VIKGELITTAKNIILSFALLPPTWVLSIFISASILEGNYTFMGLATNIATNIVCTFFILSTCYLLLSNKNRILLSIVMFAISILLIFIIMTTGQFLNIIVVGFIGAAQSAWNVFIVTAITSSWGLR